MKGKCPMLKGKRILFFLEIELFNHSSGVMDGVASRGATKRQLESPGAGPPSKASKSDDPYILVEEDNGGTIRIEESTSSADAHPTSLRGRNVLSTHRLFAQKKDKSVTEITAGGDVQYFAFPHPPALDPAPPALEIPHCIARCNCSDLAKTTMAKHFHQLSEAAAAIMEEILSEMDWPTDTELSGLMRVNKKALGIENLNLVSPQDFKVVATAEEDLINVESATIPLGVVVEKCAELFYDRAYKLGGALESKSHIIRPIAAPYLAVVQGSGVGKTTALYELAVQFQHSAFLLLSEDTTKLLPAGAPKNAILSNSKKFREMVELICNAHFPSTAMEGMASVITFAIELCNSSSGITKRDTDEPENTKIKLLVIDEAGWLVGKICASSSKSGEYNAFRLFRKALMIYCLAHPADRLVVVVADTISGVGNFVPTKYKLPDHLRVTYHNQVALNLFPVAHFPLYFDVHAERARELEFRSLASFQSYGRPLWKNSNEFHFIIQKVIGSLSTELKDMALLGTRLPMKVLQSQLASDLIGHSTALCTFVSADRDIVRCKYPSEPIVAEAVASERDLADMVIPLRNALLCRHVESGRVGELVAQFLLLQAFDLCALGKSPERKSFLETDNNHVTLNSLLAHFAQPHAVAAMGLPEEFCVFFNHFQEIETHVTPQILSQALHRGCALMLKEGARGADLAVPLYSSTAESTGETVGTLWIQVKNVASLAEGELTTIMNANRGSNVMCDSQEQYIASIGYREQVSVGLLLSLHPSSMVGESSREKAKQPVRDSTFSKKDFRTAWPHERKKFPSDWDVLTLANRLGESSRNLLKKNVLSGRSSSANKWNALLLHRTKGVEADLHLHVTLEELVQGAKWLEETAGLCVGFQSIPTGSALSKTLNQLEPVLGAVRLKKATPFNRTEQIAQSSEYVDSIISDLEKLSVSVTSP